MANARSAADEAFSSELYEAIGRLVVACSRLDAVFTDLICGFANLSAERGLILVHHQSFSSKYDSLIAILREISRDLEDQEEADSFLNGFSAAKEAYNYRNSIVHGLWTCTDDGEPIVQRYHTRGRLREAKTKVSTDEVLAKAFEVNHGCDRLVQLRENIAELAEKANRDFGYRPRSSKLGG